jgi:hypothetical protein
VPKRCCLAPALAGSETHERHDRDERNHWEQRGR